MKAEKTFIILTPGFPESESDTTCLPMHQQFVITLKELHPDMTIIVLSFQFPYHDNVYSWFGIKVIPFGGKNKGWLTKLILRRRIQSTLEEIHESNKIIGLFSLWYNECAWAGKKFAGKYGIKHLCWILGQDAKKENKYPGSIIPKPGELIALSDFIQDEFEKNHDVRPQFVVPPGIDIKQFKNFSNEKDIDILGTGSLIPLKQYDIFLEIAEGIKKEIPSIKIMLVGEGPEKERLESFIIKMGLQNNITLTGELPHPQVIELMQRTKVFLHTSSYEGFGVVCLEALYGGAHVISFCKPMKKNIEHWQIAKNKDEMKWGALKTLQDQTHDYKGTAVFSIGDTVKQVMSLFDIH